MEISLMWLGETKVAIKVTETDRGEGVWLPKSQIEYERKQDGSVDVTLPVWLYEEKEFIS